MRTNNIKDDFADERARIKRGDYGWYYYHAIENETPIIPLIVLSCFFLICRGGGLLILIAWGWYFIWAHNNNKRLDNNPEIIESRKFLRELDQKWKKEGIIK